MRSVTLDRDEQHVFARSALALRYDPTDAAAPAPVSESQLLAPRRFEDRHDDLWTVFNRVQENLTEGGLRGRSRSGRDVHAPHYRHRSEREAQPSAVDARRCDAADEGITTDGRRLLVARLFGSAGNGGR
ncbi:UNVERIFIED_ORG: hypothetical protein ABIC48_006032 [Burkholderia territorii]